VVGVSTGLATILSRGRWLRFLVISSVCTLIGTAMGFTIWPLEDGIAQSYSGVAVIAATIAAAVVCLVAGLVGRKLTALNARHRRALWIALAACVAFGPVVLVLRPGLIGIRVAHNNRMAAERFAGLKVAAERTRMEPGGAALLCDGQSLKRNYAGPPFTDRNWQHIVGNYVKEDGFVFGISIDCSQPRRYSIDVRPERERADGTRRFCTDESGKIGCGLDSSGRGERCLPCL
jgi:hypothetical protein